MDTSIATTPRTARELRAGLQALQPQSRKAKPERPPIMVGRRKPVRDDCILRSETRLDADEVKLMLWATEYDPVSGTVKVRPRHNNAAPGTRLVPVARQVWLNRFDQPFEVIHMEVQAKRGSRKRRRLDG